MLVALCLIWIAVLTPAVLRARAAHRQQPDFNDFYSSLSQLASPNGMCRSHGADPRERQRQQGIRRRTAERRRRVFNALGGTAMFTFTAAALGNSGLLWAVFGIVVFALVAYVAMLVTIAQNNRSRNLNVSYLSGPPVVQFATQRAVNS